MDTDQLRNHLESTPIEQTRADLALGHCGPVGGENHAYVSNWLKEQDASLEAAVSSRSEARQMRSLEIANESLSVARSARVWAVIAVVVSVIAILLTVSFYRGQMRHNNSFKPSPLRGLVQVLASFTYTRPQSGPS